MTYRNANFKNTGNNQGDVITFFEDHMRHLIQQNGGDHNFSFVSEEFQNIPVPHDVGNRTRIKLTHSNHTISQIEKGFINITLHLTLKLATKIAVAGDTAKCLRVFIGFKNAVEFFEEGRFYNRGQLIDGYSQEQLSRESFAYNSIKPDCAKGNTRCSTSTWENVKGFSYSICGKYIPLFTIMNGDVYECDIELVIPFTDQLALQAWQLYPNKICGEIEEEVKTSIAAMVCAMVPFETVKTTLEKQDGKPIAYDFKDTDQLPKLSTQLNKFVQMGRDLIMPTKFDKVSEENTKLEITMGKNQIEILNSRITVGRSNLAGFGLKEAVATELAKRLVHPIMVPAQELTREIFEGSASKDGLNVSKSIPLHNVTNITMMFPRHHTDITCFENIMYKNVQLTVNKRHFPDTEFETTCDGRFCQHQLVANELDGMIQPSKELIRSYVQPLNDLTNGTAYKNCRDDATSFGINFQMERSNAGYVFDGYDSGVNSVTVNFKGLPMFPGEATDMYFNVDGDKTVHPPAPEAWICSDTFWLWSTKGVTYAPPRVQIDYNEYRESKIINNDDDE